VNAGIYAFLESAAPFLVLWSFVFTLITSVRVVQRLRHGIDRAPDSMWFTELAGLPLTMLQPICFIWAVMSLDLLSTLIFLWWGPGFIAVAVLVLVTKRRGTTIDWHPVRRTISWLCKLYYLVYMAVFAYFGMPAMAFAFSVWIINDQYEKAFRSEDADRLRRTFDDWWIFRVLYPSGLLIPWIAPGMANRPFALVYGISLLVLWLAGIVFVKRRGRLFERPADATLLRNMMYFKTPPPGEA
jgi:hypothetical protein